MNQVGKSVQKAKNQQKCIFNLVHDNNPGYKPSTSAFSLIFMHFNLGYGNEPGW